MSDIEMKAKFRDWFTTKAPKQFKEMFDKTTVDEGILLEVCFHQFAEMAANDVRANEKQCNLPVVSQQRELFIAMIDKMTEQDWQECDNGFAGRVFDRLSNK